MGLETTRSSRFVDAVKGIGAEETNSGGPPSLCSLEFSGGVFRGVAVSWHRFDCVEGRAVCFDEIGARGIAAALGTAQVYRVRERRGYASGWAAEIFRVPAIDVFDARRRSAGE